MLSRALGVLFTVHAFHFDPLPTPCPYSTPLPTIDHMLRMPGVHALCHDDYLHTATHALRCSGRPVARLDGCEYLLKHDDGDPLRWILSRLGLPSWIRHATALPSPSTIIVENAELIDNVVPCASAFANIPHLCVFFVFSSDGALTRALADAIMRLPSSTRTTARLAPYA